MTPFDDNLYQPNEDVIEQDDLIAFHLNELPHQQVRAVHRALQSNPALQAESMAIAATLHAFPKHEPALPLDAAALNRMWRTLQPSLPIYTAPPVVPSSLFARMSPRWAFPAIAGSALVATALLVAVHHSRHTQPPTLATISTPSSTTPTPAPAPSTASHPELPSSVSPNEFNLRPQPTNHAWPPSSAPLETATATPPPQPFPAQSPTPLTPTTPSIAPSGTAPTKSATPPPPSPTQTQPTAETLAQASTQSPIHRGRSRWRSPFHNSPANELTLGIFGDLAIASRATLTDGTGTSAITQSVSQSPGATVGALASFRQQFSPFRGYSLTGAYVSLSSGSKGLQIYEVAGTYVVQGPRLRRLTTSAEAGAALVATTYDNSHTFHPAAVIGIGSELALSRHWGLRAEYRAQFYKSPALFSTIAPLGISVSSSNNTFDSNAIVGVTYLFGRRSND
ncbi:MAG: hypothetical protein WB439_13920 [Acidobacteriaceae bacterium]